MNWADVAFQKHMLKNTFTEWKDILSQFDNFHHGVLQEIEIGQREELLLTLMMQSWQGQIGYHGNPVKLRFGGVIYDEDIPRTILETLPSEIAYLRLVEDTSKQNSLHVELLSERENVKVEWTCKNIQVLDDS